MLNYNDGQQLLLAIEPIDFRKGIQRLIALCQQELLVMPDINIWFAFTNKKRIAVKIISLDSTGYWLATKYFAKGKLALWPSGHARVTTRHFHEST